MKKIIPTNSILIPDTAEPVFKGVFYSVYQWPQTMFDGSTATFEMLKRTDTVVTIGVTEDKLVIIEDEQPHNGKKLSFPGGRVEVKDSDILAAAKRETLEETGLSFSDWRLIKVVQPSNEIEWFVHIWLATNNVTKVEPTPDVGEKISAAFLDFDEVKNKVMNDTGVLGENRDIFSDLNSLDDLLNLPEYPGHIIDR